MEKTDKRILNRIQEGLPLSLRPYRDMAQELGITEDELFCRVEKLVSKGIIRRIGATFNSSKLGFTSTLIAMKVGEEKLEKVVSIINSFPEITHNYLRDSEFNLWFTLIVHYPERIEEIINYIKKETDIRDIINLNALKLFKINVKFNLLKK